MAEIDGYTVLHRMHCIEDDCPLKLSLSKFKSKDFWNNFGVNSTDQKHINLGFKESAEPQTSYPPIKNCLDRCKKDRMILYIENCF